MRLLSYLLSKCALPFIIPVVVFPPRCEYAAAAVAAAKSDADAGAGDVTSLFTIGVEDDDDAAARRSGTSDPPPPPPYIGAFDTRVAFRAKSEESDAILEKVDSVLEWTPGTEFLPPSISQSLLVNMHL
jgi:hypothetical protein